MEEKRKSPRKPVSMEVTYQSGDEFVSSYLHDISGGGVYIKTSDPPEAETQLNICFHVPGLSDSFLVDVTVMWSQDSEASENPGMGVRFDRMEPGDRQRLSSFLESFDEI